MPFEINCLSSFRNSCTSVSLSGYITIFLAYYIGTPTQVCDVDEFMFFDKLLSDIGGIFNEYIVLPGVRLELSDAVLPSLHLVIVNAIT